MRVVVRDAGAEREMTVDPRSSVAAFLDTLTGDRAGGRAVFVDGTPLVAGATTVGDAGMLDGSTISWTAADRVTEPFEAVGPALVELHQIAGLRAGGFLRLPAGRYEIGTLLPRPGSLRAGIPERSTLRLTVREDGRCETSGGDHDDVVVDGVPLGGTVVLTDQHVEAPGAVFRVTPAMDRHRPRAGQGGEGLVTVPRAPGLSSPLPLEPPAPPPVREGRGRRARRGDDVTRSGDEDVKGDLVWQAGRDLTAGWRAALAAARAASPDVAELRARARVAAPSLWQRRPADAGQIVTVVGYGTGRWRPTELTSSLPPELQAMFHTTLDLPSVPVTVDLRTGPVGIFGPAGAVDALARWLVLQLAVLHGPDDLSLDLRVDEDPTPDWRWVRWLPQLGDRNRPGTGEHRVIVEHAADGRASNAGDAALVVLAPSRAHLPRSCTVLIHVADDGRFALAERASGRREEGTVIGIGVDVASAVARDLAPLML